MLEVVQAVADKAKNLVPPEIGASERHIRRWRLWIAFATFLNAMGLSAHILLACGFAAPFYSGFAQAADLQSVQQSVDDVRNVLMARREKELASLILDAKQKFCSTQGEVKQLRFASMNDLRAEYYKLTHREFSDPPCTDFQ